MPKFKNIKPKPEAKTGETKTVSFNLSKVVGISFLAGVVVLAFILVGYNIQKEYNSWSSSWDQVMFAKNNPEIVKVVKLEYEDGLRDLDKRFLAPEQVEEEASKL